MKKHVLMTGATGMVGGEALKACLEDEEIGRRIYPVLKAIYANGVVTSRHLAEAMLTVGLNGGDQPIYENPEIRKITK